HFHFRAVRFVNTGERIVAAVAVAPAHALLLSVSHFRKSLCSAATPPLIRFSSSAFQNQRQPHNPPLAFRHSPRLNLVTQCFMPVNQESTRATRTSFLPRTGADLFLCFACR